MYAPQYDEHGVAHYTERQIDVITEIRKVRPALSAFGDWNQYDEAGNVSLVIDGVTRIVSEDDDLRNDWGYATQQEQRKEERGDEPTYDPSVSVWFTRKGDKVERVYVAQEIERTYDPLHGYHKEADGIVSCYYCGTTFSARYWVMQSKAAGTLDRVAMERFTTEAMQHTVACKAEHFGQVMARMVTWSGKPILRSTASMFR